MGKDSDDLVSLPSPPPPRPAARRAAIETALRKFDGIEEVPAGREPSRIRWATMHRRPAGALVAATLIVVVAIPAIQVALRDRPPEATSEERATDPVQPGRDAAPAMPPSGEPQASHDRPVAVEAPRSAMQAPASPTIVAEDRSGFISADSDQKAGVAAPAPVMAAPAPPPLVAAPPPPPPPPAEAQAEAAASESGNIVVTGSRVRRSNLESATPVTVIDAHDEFLSRLQAGLRANDRRAVVRLIALPLRVKLGGEVRTYRSSRDVERDFDRIFTADVRQAALNLRPDTLVGRDGGRLKGNGRLWFGCLKTTCSSDGSIRIREVNP